MFKIKKIAQKILGLDKSTTKNYWKRSAKFKTENTISRICTGFDQKTFETKKESIIFSKEFQISSESIVLDLACGMGRVCKWVSPKVKQYVGVDFIPEMIKKAKNYNSEQSNAKFVVNDGKTLNILSDETFDVVFCELAFQHMEKPIQQSYVPEIFRVLKFGGSFYGQIPKFAFYNDNSFALTKLETDKLFKKFKLSYLKDGTAGHAYYYIKAVKP